MIKILFFVEEENTTHIISNYMARIIFASDFPSPRINSKPLAYIYIYIYDWHIWPRFESDALMSPPIRLAHCSRESGNRGADYPAQSRIGRSTVAVMGAV